MSDVRSKCLHCRENRKNVGATHFATKGLIKGELVKCWFEGTRLRLEVLTGNFKNARIIYKEESGSFGLIPISKLTKLFYGL